MNPIMATHTITVFSVDVLGYCARQCAMYATMIIIGPSINPEKRGKDICGVSKLII
jgi:hypothetical protein